MVDAINELTKKLTDYGFVLKVCQCCSHFTSNIDGSTNMVKGFCNNQFANTQTGALPTLLWNSCRGFACGQQCNSIIEEIAQWEKGKEGKGKRGKGSLKKTTLA